MNQLTALIVEDDQNLAIIFEEAMHAAGLTTRVAYSGDTALKELAEHIPDIVILDLHLPKVSGLSVLHCIKTDVHFSTTRVIIATADPLITQTIADQADLVLVKPISFTQLRDMTLRILGKS